MRLINGRIMSMPVNPIKEENLKLLRTLLRQERTATKSRLAELSGLSVVTVQSLTKALLDAGEVYEDSVVQPMLGRPAASFRYNETAALALVIYMYEKNTRDTTAFLVCNLYGECIDRKETSFAEIARDSFDTDIESMLAKYPQIKVIAFGMPGEEIDGEIVISDCKALLHTNFAAYIRGRFGVDVFLENDINAAVFGYCMRNRLTESTSAAGIYMPSKYPPGSGICQNGRILKGRNGLAGEIMYLPLGIDWRTFDYSRAAVEDFLIRTIKIFMCINNPDRIVLYCEQMDADFAVKLRESCRTRIETIMLPDLEIKKELKDDFELGMISLALEKIL